MAKDILKMEGLIVRLIPKTTESLFNKSRFENKPNQVLFYHKGYKREMVKETNQNSLGGKYLVMFEDNQMTTVRFDLKTCGVGDTIEDALKDYMLKKVG